MAGHLGCDSPSCDCSRCSGSNGSDPNRGGPATTLSEVEQAAADSAQLFVEAFNRGDAAAIAAMWTADGDYIDELGTRVVGRAAIQQAYAKFFADHPGAQINVVVDRVQQLGADTLLEDGHSQLLDPAGWAPQSRYSTVHVQQAGNWLMASVREAPLAVAAPVLADLGWLVGQWATPGGEVAVTYDWLGQDKFLRGETTITTAEGTTPGGTQIIGQEPLSGNLVSWSFNPDGSLASSVWAKQGAHWVIQSLGATADGQPTSAVNILYDADDNVHSWQSVNRVVGDQALPRTTEIVLQRVPAAPAAGR